MNKPEYYDFTALCSYLKNGQTPELMLPYEITTLISELHKVKYFTNRYKVNIVDFDNIIENKYYCEDLKLWIATKLSFINF